MAGAANHRGASRQDYGTPWEFIAAVEAQFGPISFDLAASWTNAKTPWYLCEAHNALEWDWQRLERVFGRRLWLNPPFGNIAPWAAKCAASGASVLLLVQASVGSNWWRDHVHGRAFAWFLNGLICFDGKNGFPKDCALIEYGGRPPGYTVWSWRNDVPTDVPPAEPRLFGKVAA